MPKRVQRKRIKGWRLPENCVSIARPSIWGNPFVVGKPCGVFPKEMGLHGKEETLIPKLSLEQSLEFYESMLSGCTKPEMYPFGHDWVKHISKRYREYWHPSEAIRHELAGKDLACFCPLDQRCHADIALVIANKW